MLMASFVSREDKERLANLGANAKGLRVECTWPGTAVLCDGMTLEWSVGEPRL